MINIYRDEERKELVGVVNYNNKLDYVVGTNWQNGGVGYHKGITKLKDGSYVIIIGSDYQGDKDYGYIVSENEALKEIIESGNLELLQGKKFKSLRELYEKSMLIEDETEDDI